LRFIGAALPAWLERRYGGQGLSDLARLEWARSDIFDVIDEPTSTVDALRAWPVDEFLRLPVKLVAAHRIVTVDFAITAFWERIGAAPTEPAEHQGEAGCAHAAPIDAEVEASELPGGESILVWRQGPAVYHRPITGAERGVLELAARGTTFGAICDALPAFRTTEEASAQAFAWLWSWTTAELLVAP
jgi:hypothetical protein